jgi:hypothetical protein
MPDERQEELLLADKERVEVVARAASGLCEPPGVYVVGALLVRGDLEAALPKGGGQASRKGSLAGASPEPGYDYPWYREFFPWCAY